MSSELQMGTGLVLIHSLFFRTLQKQIEQAKRHGAQLADIVEKTAPTVR